MPEPPWIPPQAWATLYAEFEANVRQLETTAFSAAPEPLDVQALMARIGELIPTAPVPSRLRVGRLAYAVLSAAAPPPAPPGLGDPLSYLWSIPVIPDDGHGVCVWRLLDQDENEIDRGTVDDRYRVARDGVFLAIRALAEDARHQARPYALDGVLVLDFDGVQAVSVGYADEFVAPLADDFRLTILDANADVGMAIATALGRRNLLGKATFTQSAGAP